MPDPSPTAKRIAKRLKSLVLELGSLNAVAKKYSVNVGMLSAIVNGKKKPPYKLLEALGIVSKRQPEAIRWRWVGRWVAKHGEGFIR